MTPILCVTDFSDRTRDALRAATAFAQRWGGRVVLVRSVDERGQFAFPLRARLVQQDWRRLEREARELRAEGFDFDEKVLAGLPEDGIAAFAWASRARLIVVGCAPTGVIERWAVGCLAEEIAEGSLVPVLAVRSAGSLERWLAGSRALNVFAAADPAGRPDALLNRLDELRDAGECEVTAGFVPYPEVRHATAPRPPDCGEHEFRTRPGGTGFMAEFRARGIPVSALDAARHVEAVLVDRAQAAGADLLVITSHPHDDAALLPPRCLAGGVLRRAPMNVLCVPEPDIEPARVGVTAGRAAAALVSPHGNERNPNGA